MITARGQQCDQIFFTGYYIFTLGHQAGWPLRYLNSFFLIFIFIFTHVEQCPSREIHSDFLMQSEINIFH